MDDELEEEGKELEPKISNISPACNLDALVLHCSESRLDEYLVAGNIYFRLNLFLD